MLEVVATVEFTDWLAGLRDVVGAARIAQRIDRVAKGNLGDYKSIDGDLSELRFTFGLGYRVYFMIRGRTVVILLCGGDKGTQRQDIEWARALAEEIGR